MKQSVIIIGGGFAGLSAATSLAERGFRVTVLEGRQVLGGRAWSFRDPQTGDCVDNGQHLFMACYHQTRAFLRRIDTAHLLKFQPTLSVDFAGNHGRRATLSCLPLPAPYHLASGLLRLSTLSWGDRWRLRHVERALRDASRHPETLDGMTIEQWLIQARQSSRARRYLWDLIAIAAINEDPRVAAATGFVQVLRQAFFEEWHGSRLGLSTVGLSDLYAPASQQMIESYGGQVRLKAPVSRLELRDGRVAAVWLRDGQKLAADWVISAVPPQALLKLLPQELVTAEPQFGRIGGLRSSSIISIHLWFDRDMTKKLFVGMLDTQVQWLFNKAAILGGASTPGYVSLVISGARTFADWSESRILSMALEELRRVFPEARQAALLRSLAIKEHQATLSPVPGSDALRPDPTTPVRNLFLAGDWTQTHLPATIESACASGHACADLITLRKASSSPLVGGDTGGGESHLYSAPHPCPLPTSAGACGLNKSDVTRRPSPARGEGVLR